MKRRRGRGEGGIYERADGQWCASLAIGYDAKGKRRRRVIYGVTKAALLEKLKQLYATSPSGVLNVQSTRLTVAQYLNHWLGNVARPRIRPTTYKLYEGLIRLHINPRIGGLRLSKLTATHIEALYAELARDGVSSRNRQLVHARLYTSLKKAVRLKLIPHNVCLDVDRPVAKKKEFPVFDPGQASRFLDAARRDRLFALYVLAVTTGLRQGELLGLWWDDIDLDRGTLSVRGQLQEVAGALARVEPKTKESRRRVTLPAAAVSALRSHRERMQREGANAPWVFCDTSGGPIRKSNLRRRSFEPLLKRSGLPRIRFHDLRHTAATLLLNEDVHPKVVQERLGHARIQITLDLYSHVLPSMQQGAADKLDRLFARLKRKDWLQLGYKNTENVVLDEDAQSSNCADSEEEIKWSHVDLNHGPPACEAGALTS